MTKGKYKARAANREIARDNELIVEKVEEITDLKQKLADIERELARERAERGALVVTRAAELSAEQIATIRAEAERRVAQQAKDMKEVAKFFMDYFHKEERYPHGFVDKVMPLLIPDSVERNEAINAVFENHQGHKVLCPLHEHLDHDHDSEGALRVANRRTRRHAGQNISRSHKEMSKKDAGVELLVRKGLVSETALEQI